MPSVKFDVMLDLQGNAHALLNRNYSYVYNQLLLLWNSTRDFTYWYVDDRANPTLFFGLLSFAQPEIFKVVYTNPDKAITVICDALKYMYHSPLEVKHANDLLDEQLDAQEENE